MTHGNILDSRRAALVIIDMQEAFRPSIADFTEIAARIAACAEAARLLDLPIMVTEQYPKGLGRTAEEIKTKLSPDVTPLEKTSFSACGADGFSSRLQQAAVQQVLICGIEAHVCINQTTHDLLARGYQVHLLTDCISSRAEHNKQAALAKMVQSGALHSSLELALFELMRGAEHAQFKVIQKLIK